MKVYYHSEYSNWSLNREINFPDTFALVDHLNGFDENLHNDVLERINQQAYNLNKKYEIVYHNILLPTAHKYTNLQIKFSAELQKTLNFPVLDANCDKEFLNFICSFNGTDHLSRQFLTSALHKLKWFNPEYCSKNFIAGRDRVDGNVASFFNKGQDAFYRKFIINDLDDEFYNTVYGFNYNRFDHNSNVKFLNGKINCSFIQIVSESMATSYQPFITEKFLYSVATKGLFVTYGQPGWHEHVDHYYGFKKYNKIFNYQFDSIANPVARLIELLGMIAKFEKLSKFDWHDLYSLEQDTIEYNYDWYYSKKYLEKLKDYE